MNLKFIFESWQTPCFNNKWFVVLWLNYPGKECQVILYLLPFLPSTFSFYRMICFWWQKHCLSLDDFNREQETAACWNIQSHFFCKLCQKYFSTGRCLTRRLHWNIQFYFPSHPSFVYLIYRSPLISLPLASSAVPSCCTNVCIIPLSLSVGQASLTLDIKRCPVDLQIPTAPETVRECYPVISF